MPEYRVARIIYLLCNHDKPSNQKMLKLLVNLVAANDAIRNEHCKWSMLIKNLFLYKFETLETLASGKVVA